MQKTYDIEIENVSKEFKIGVDKRPSFAKGILNTITATVPKRKLVAVDDVSLKIEKGEMMGITGRNGSGKSTLLSLICSIIRPTAGKITVNGKISSFLQLGVGFEPELSARENVFIYSALLGVPENQVRKNITEIMKFAELQGFENTKLKNYSWGMRSRLAFSVAVQSRFDILLLDEVLAVGDRVFREKCFEKIRQFKKEKKTIVFVSHDESSIKRFCDRCILMDKGKIIKEGDPKDVISYYESHSLNK